MPKRLYRLDIPDRSRMQSGSEYQREVASQGTLGGGPGAVTPISVEPNQNILRGQFRALYADLMAAEVEELFGSDFQSVAYYSVNSQSKEDGYYALENIDVGALDPRESGIQQFDGLLRFMGTRSSHFRELEVNPTKIDYPGANTLECHVGIPADASDVQWYNPSTEEATPASPETSRTTEFGDVEVYDASPEGPSPYSTPSLVYELAYDREGFVDAKLWDDHDRDKFDGEGVCAWQRVFSPGHDYRGVPVLDNGLVRAHMNTSDGLLVEAYDSGTETWNTVSLGSSDWSLANWDVREVSPTSIRTRFTFQHTDDSTYRLDGFLHRGQTSIQFDRVEDSGVPSGLETKLSPVASGLAYDPGSGLGLRERTEVQ